jgi:hypothetical protein
MIIYVLTTFNKLGRDVRTGKSWRATLYCKNLQKCQIRKSGNFGEHKSASLRQVSLILEKKVFILQLADFRTSLNNVELYCKALRSAQGFHVDYSHPTTQATQLSCLPLQSGTMAGSWKTSSYVAAWLSW